MSNEEITNLLKQYQEGNKPPEKDKKYYLFGSGQYENQGYQRVKPTYKKQIELDELRIKTEDFGEAIKEEICRRHKWGEYTEKKQKRYGKDCIKNDLNEVDFIKKALELLAKDLPTDYDFNDVDTGEAERLVTDFLRDCRA